MGSCLSSLTNNLNLAQHCRERQEKLLKIKDAKECCEKKVSTTKRHHERGVFKILILGTGESGKSTLIKQMKIIHNEGYSPDEVCEFRPIILDNVVSTMKYVVTGMRLLNIEFQFSKNKELAKKLILCNEYFNNSYVLYSHLKHILKLLWDDKGVKEAVARGFEYELNDSALYLLDNIERLTREDYTPNTKDILKSRIRTIGVVETEFRVDNLYIRMFDVGGQRSERRKWIQYFDDVQALLFVVAISEYDMTLIEDADRNRLRESFQLFENVSNNIIFKDVVTLLFLNKVDLFREKILFTDRQLRYFIEEYTGPDYDPDGAALFIETSFRQLAFSANPEKHLYTHFTTATDTINIKNVLDGVVETILTENVRQSTLL